MPGIGPKTAAQLIARYGPLEAFPPDALRGRVEEALLFKRLATLRADAPLFDDVDALRWRGPSADFAATAERIGDAKLLPRVASLQSKI
jgi:5'-3' exonuclease